MRRKSKTNLPNPNDVFIYPFIFEISERFFQLRISICVNICEVLLEGRGMPRDEMNGG